MNFLRPKHSHNALTGTGVSLPQDRHKGFILGAKDTRIFSGHNLPLVSPGVTLRATVRCDVWRSQKRQLRN